MKISELIELQSTIKNENGNLDVDISTDGDWSYKELTKDYFDVCKYTKTLNIEEP